MHRVILVLFLGIASVLMPGCCNDLFKTLDGTGEPVYVPPRHINDGGMLTNDELEGAR